MLPVFSSLTPEAQEALHEAITNLDRYDSKPRDVPGVGEVAYVAGERINSENSIVFSLNGKLYELTGYYSSYEGTTWDDLDSVYEVTPREKTITVYDKV